MEIDTSKLMKSSLGLIGSDIGAYTNLSPIEDIEQYVSQAQQLGNINYQLGSLQSLADQYAQRNIPQSITGKTLYNPSAWERFGQLFGSGMSGFQAGYNFADNFTDNMGSTFIKGKTGFNTQTQKGWGPSDNSLGNVLEGQRKGNTSDFTEEEIRNTFSDPDQFVEGTYAGGGFLELNHGSMVNAASGLAMAGINMGLNAIENSQRRKQAEQDALRYNALRDFAIDRNTLDFQRAVEDSTDNMFNMQALQMKAMGGNLNTNGATWTNGLTTINNGGTHEENPLDGVPMGIAPDGIPNLVEEGEVIYNDYVFSNRLKANKTLLDKYNLPTKYEGKSYAEVSKELSKESEERPNDPISKKGLEDSMTKLQQAQEEYKAIKDQEKLEKALAKLTPEEQEMLLAQNTEGMPQQAFDKGGILIRKWDEAEGDIEESKKAKEWLETLPSTLMRYTPTLIQGIQALKGNKVDYTNPNLIAANTRNINFTPLGDYMALERLPFVSTIGNKMQAQQAATNAAIMNTAANRAAAIPSLITSGYKGQTALADAALEAAKYNNMLTETEANFNRGTNQANLTAGLDVEKANQQLAYQSAVQQAAMREAIDQYISESNSTNLSTFLDNIQGIGREMDAIREAKKTTAANSAYGGKLNKRKKKGLTC